MQIQSAGQWAGQKQQGGRKTHTRGTPGDGACQPPDRGTNQHLHGSDPISSDPGSGVTCQTSWDVQSSMLKCLLVLVFCVRRITFSHGHCRPWAVCLQLEEGWTALELRCQEQRVEPEMSLLPSVCSHCDTSTHGLPWQYPQEALHAFSWLLRTTWLVLTPQPHYRATLWRGQEISFQLHNFEIYLKGVLYLFSFLQLQMEKQ